MRREEHTTLGGHDITVRELTVGEVRAWLASVEQIATEIDSGRPDVVALFLLDDCTFADLQRMSTVTAEQLDSLGQAELRDLAAKCRELNPDFFGLRSRLLSLGRQREAPAS